MSEIKKHISAFIIVFLILFASIDTLVFGTNKNETVKLIGCFIFLGCAVFEFIKVFIFRRKRANLLSAIFLSFGLVIALILNADFDPVYIYAVVVVFLSYLLAQDISIEDFKRYYTRILDIISVFSLIGYALHAVSMTLVEKLPAVINTTGIYYYNMLFAVIPQDIPYVTHRLYGIFREPGVFALYLILGLLFELFNKSRPFNIKRLVLYVVALILTFSTAGYLCAFLLFFTWICQRSCMHQHRKVKILLFFVGVISIIGMLSSPMIYNRVFSKFFVGGPSTMSRFGAFEINLRIAFRDILHLIFGSGFEFTNREFVLLGKEVFGITIHNTNTILKMLAVCGLPFCCYVSCGIVKFCGKFSKGLIAFIGLIFVIAMLLFNEDIILNPLFYIIFFYGIKRENLSVCG